MELIKIRSQKHPDAIFLKVKKSKDDFICKIYARNSANYIADTIIRALTELEIEDGNRNDRISSV